MKKTRGRIFRPQAGFLTQAERLHKTACESPVREEDKRASSGASPYDLHSIYTPPAHGLHLAAKRVRRPAARLSDGEEGFGPLDDMGSGNAGCTWIKYKRGAAWVTL
jgi:hypothetical protein